MMYNVLDFTPRVHKSYGIKYILKVNVYLNVEKNLRSEFKVNIV
jgi:hypothetical protein